MPIYEYVCPECGETREVLERINTPRPEQQIPTCTACYIKKRFVVMQRKISRSNFVIKKGGLK